MKIRSCTFATLLDSSHKQCKLSVAMKILFQPFPFHWTLTINYLKTKPVIRSTVPLTIKIRSFSFSLKKNVFRISNTASVDEITNSVLRVKTIESDQYGDYYCKASNKVGHSEARINLYGKFVPGCILIHLSKFNLFSFFIYYFPHFYHLLLWFHFCFI